jgi:hypothetical protein
MESLRTPRIISADRLADSIIVTFEDGRCAIYSASLLYAAFPHAEEVVESEDEE